MQRKACERLSRSVTNRQGGLQRALADARLITVAEKASNKIFVTTTTNPPVKCVGDNKHDACNKSHPQPVSPTHTLRTTIVSNTMRRQKKKKKKTTRAHLQSDAEQRCAEQTPHHSATSTTKTQIIAQKMLTDFGFAKASTRGKATARGTPASLTCVEPSGRLSLRCRCVVDCWFMALHS